MVNTLKIVCSVIKLLRPEQLNVPSIFSNAEYISSIDLVTKKPFTLTWKVWTANLPTVVIGLLEASLVQTTVGNG